MYGIRCTDPELRAAAELYDAWLAGTNVRDHTRVIRTARIMPRRTAKGRARKPTPS